MSLKAKITLTALLGATWVAATVFGAHALLKYENAPGKVGHISSAWPANSAIQQAPDRPTLVMLAHPQCPCTRASMDELAQVMARVQGKVRAYVLFYTPRDAGPEWQNTDTRRSAAQIPGVIVLSDIDGAQAERFGAETSGHTFLFDQNGQLLFNGGITASRGHSGDNVGENAVISLVNDESTSPAHTLVFGCSLHERNQQKPCLK